MWVLVDKLADDRGGVPWLSKWLMQKGPETPAWKKTFQQAVAFIKEFRAILIEYFKWSKPKTNTGWKCKFCSKEAKWWCPNTKQKFCPQCAYNQNHANAHSLEEMHSDWERKGFHIITPVLPDIMFAGLVYYMFFHVTLMGPDYLTTQVTCPVVSRARSFTAGFDANLFYYYKQSFFTWCDVEDSFLRFIMDGWVRSIVTQTDNTLLVFQTLPSALLVNVALSYTLVPFASFLYALLASAVYAIESRIELPTAAPGEPEPIWLSIHNFLWTWNGSVFFADPQSSAFPPETKPRTRDASDPLEGFWYWKERTFRNLNYYYLSTGVSLQNLTSQLLMVTFYIRLACIWVGGFAGVAKVSLGMIGFQSLISAQEVWYKGASSLVNEELLRDLAAKFYAIIDHWLRVLPPVCRQASFLWVFGLTLWVLCVSVFATYLVYYRRAFKDHWAKDAKNHMNFGQANYLQPKAASPAGPASSRR